MICNVFSGIISHRGTLESITEKAKGFLFAVHAPTLIDRITLGASVANDGVCLTVVETRGETVMFEVMPETLKKSTLEHKKTGDTIHLEPSLRIGDELGGHFVYGHVDGVGVVTEIEEIGDTRLITIEQPQELMKYIAQQGSVALDGVSLTVARLTENTFTVSLIEYTQHETGLGSAVVGQNLNVECDMLAKYVERLMKTQEH